MTGLIDSIWKNYHIPSLVFVSKKDSDGDEILVCVDGKQVSFRVSTIQINLSLTWMQRLTSILKFMDGTVSACP